MDLRRTSKIAAAGVCLVVLSALAFSQAHRGPSDTAPISSSSGAQTNFVDFVLKRINPADIDYGKYLKDGRAVLLEETLRNGYFWSNVIALTMLCCLFLVVVHQRNVETRRIRMSALIITQYEESLRRSNLQIDEATRRNNSLKDVVAALRETTLRSASPNSDSPQQAVAVPTKPRATGARVATPTDIKTNASKVATATAEQADQMALFKTDAALIMKVNALEQKLSRSEEQQKELRRQLNEVNRKLQAEQDKNRALKGA